MDKVKGDLTELMKMIYLPIGVPTFHMPSAQALFEKSKTLLASFHEDLIAPDEMLLSISLLESFIKDKHVDLVIVQNITFANSAYMTTILKHLKSPVLHWTLREPVIDGGRLRLNSLTGAFSAGYAFAHMREDHLLTLIGSPDEDHVKTYLKQVISAIQVK
ncbi:MAG TPA: fucose isomerase, partial [Acholeplasmataceae bacterium]|nr:fucose isomerase [Acholeplasmataceae bacterium]